MKYVLPIASSFGGGVLVGGAYAAFIALIKLFPRILQLTETNKYEKLYQDIFLVTSFCFTLIYFSDFSINVGTFGIVISGLFFGIFIGLFSAALAETLNVIPVISKKFKLKRQLIIVFYALVLGKVLGALYYFICLIGGLTWKI